MDEPRPDLHGDPEIWDRLISTARHVQVFRNQWSRRLRVVHLQRKHGLRSFLGRHLQHVSDHAEKWGKE